MQAGIVGSNPPNHMTSTISSTSRFVGGDIKAAPQKRRRGRGPNKTPEQKAAEAAEKTRKREEREAKKGQKESEKAKRANRAPRRAHKGLKVHESANAAASILSREDAPSTGDIDIALVQQRIEEAKAALLEYGVLSAESETDPAEPVEQSPQQDDSDIEYSPNAEDLSERHQTFEEEFEEADKTITTVPSNPATNEPVQLLMAAWDKIKQDRPLPYDPKGYLKRITIPGRVVDRPACESCGKPMTVVNKHLKCYTLSCVLRRLPKDHPAKKQAIDGSNAVRRHNWQMELAQEAAQDKKERPAYPATLAAVPYECMRKRSRVVEDDDGDYDSQRRVKKVKPASSKVTTST